MVHVRRPSGWSVYNYKHKVKTKVKTESAQIYNIV